MSYYNKNELNKSRGGLLSIHGLKSFYREMDYPDITTRAAESAFFTTLAIFPCILFIVTAMAYIPVLQIERFLEYIKGLMPSEAFRVIQMIIDLAVSSKSMGFLIFTLVFALWSFSKSVKAIIKGMNRAYGVEEERGFFHILFVSIGCALAMLINILLSMTLLVYGDKIIAVIVKFVSVDKEILTLWNIARHILSICAATIVFITFFKYSPNKKLKIKEVLPGSILTTLIWLAISYLYSFYTNHFSGNEKLYGSMTEIIILMTWIYLLSMSITIGYKINSIIKKRYGNKSLKIRY